MKNYMPIILFALVASYCLFSLGSCDIPYKTSEQKIFSLKPGNELSGKFVMGSGSIGSGSYYYFYVKESDGYILKKINAAQSILIESTSDPRIVQIYFGDSLYGLSKIYVPKGTLVRKFNSF